MSGNVNVGTVSATFKMDVSDLKSSLDTIKKSLRAIRDSFSKLSKSTGLDSLKEMVETLKSTEKQGEYTSKAMGELNKQLKSLHKEGKVVQSTLTSVNKEFQGNSVDSYITKLSKLATQTKTVGNVIKGFQKDQANLNKAFSSVTTSFMSNAEKVALKNMQFNKLSKELLNMGSGYLDYSRSENRRKGANVAQQEVDAWNRVKSVIYQTEAGFNLLSQTMSGVDSKFDKITQSLTKSSESMKGLNNAFKGLYSGGKGYLSATREELQKASTQMKQLFNWSGIGSNASNGMGLLDQQLKNSNNNLRTLTREIQNARKQMDGLRSSSSYMQQSLVNLRFPSTVTKGISLLDQQLKNSNNSLRAVTRETQNARNKMEALRQSSSYMQQSLTSGFSANVTKGMSLLDQQLNNTNEKLRTMATEAQRARNQMAMLRSYESSYTSRANVDATSTLTKLKNSVSSSYISRLSSEFKASTNAINGFGSSAQNAKSKTDGLSSGIGTLIGKLSMVRSMVSMVSSIFIWQFASGLISATSESVNAKSEMESLFQQMDMGAGSIKKFNESLDETVSKYQKLNKYSMGETVASLGVEFDLTNAQMSKAMPILAMVQSEYLRAGRSTEEATLAVKDIMQGELLRLSRETGVGQSELKNAGWNGMVQTKEDIDSLLDALEKVGTSRHWDVFASKASSLNDMVLITTNRFSEFSADMVSMFTPAILVAFNTITGAIDGVMGAFEGLSDFDKMLVGIPALTAVVGGLVGAFVKLRTGMGLVDIAQQGFARSIVASIFQIDKKTMSSYKLRDALTSVVTGIDKVTVKQIGWKNALASCVLGVDASKVKVHGLGNALAWMSDSLSSTSKQFLTNNRYTLKWHQGLAVLTKGVEASTAKNYAWYKSLAQVATSMAMIKALAFSGVLIGIAVALGSVYSACQKAKNAVEGFSYVVENGEDIISDAQTTYETYAKRVTELQSEVSSATDETTKTRKQTELNKVLEARYQAYKNVGIAQQAYKMAQEEQTKLDQRQASAQLKNQDILAKNYEKMGLSKEQAWVQASQYTRDVVEGTKVLEHAQDEYDHRLYASQQHMNEHLEQLEQAGASTDELKSYMEDYNAEALRTADFWKQFNEGDMMAGLYAIMSELTLMWIDLWNDKDFVNFWNDLNDIWKDCEPTLRAIGDALKNLGWDSLKSLAGAISELKEHVGTAGTLAGVATGILGIGYALKTVGDIVKGSDWFGGVFGGKGKNKDSDGKTDKKDKKDKKSEKTGKTGKTGSGGIIFGTEGSLIQNLKAQAQIGVQLASGLAIAIGLITEAILLLTVPMLAMAGLGTVFKAVEKPFTDGCTALKAFSDCIMQNIPMILAFVAVITVASKLKLYETSVAKDGAKTIAVAILLVAEAIVLLIAPMLALGALGWVSSVLGDNVNKGIEAIKTTTDALYALIPWIPLFIFGTMIATSAFGNIQVVKNWVAGIALGIGLVAEAIILMVAPIVALAGVGWVASQLGDNVDKGIEAMQTTTEALYALAPWVPVFLTGVALVASVFAGGAGIAILGTAFIGIPVGVLLIAEAITSLKIPLQTLADVGKSYPDLSGVKQGAEAIKAVSEALGYLNDAMDSTVGIVWDDFCAWILTNGEGMSHALEDITSEDGVVMQIKEFIPAFNKAMSGIQPINTTLVDNLITAVDSITSIHDSLKKCNDTLAIIVGNNGGATGDGKGGVRSDATFKGKLDALIDDITDIGEFTEEVAKITISDISSQATNIANASTAIDNLKTALTTVRDALIISDYLNGDTSGGEGSADSSDLKAKLDQLKKDIGDIASFTSALTGDGSEDYTIKDISAQASSLQTTVTGIQALQSALEQIKSTIQVSNELNAQASMSGGAGIGNGLYNMQTGGASETGGGLKAKLDQLKADIQAVLDFNSDVSGMTSEGDASGAEGACNMVTAVAQALDQLYAKLDEGAGTVIEKGRAIGTNIVDGIKFGMSTLHSQVNSVVQTAFDPAIETCGTKGREMGTRATDGFKFKIKDMSNIMSSECDEIIKAIDGKTDEAYQAGARLGQAVKNGFNSTSAINHNSPGNLAKLIIAEGDEIVIALSNIIPSASSMATNVGSSIVSSLVPSMNELSTVSDLMSNDLVTQFDTVGATLQNTANGLTQVQMLNSNMMAMSGMNPDANQSALAQYSSDASTAIGISQTTVDSAMIAFQGLDIGLGATFGNMEQTTATTFNNMSATASRNYTNIANISKVQLNNMQSQTTKNIGAIRTSWTGMQNALIQSAENIRSQTGAKIKNLENNMASFWRKVQNPGTLIASVSGGINVSQGRNGGRSIGTRRSVAGTISRVSVPRGNYAGGMGISNRLYPKRGKSKTMPDSSIDGSLLSCLCNGDCYAGGWNFNWTPQIMKKIGDWRTHFGAIYDAKLRVGKFENDDFPVRGDADIFRNYVVDAIGRTSYEMYYNSKYGSALGAWNAGHFNCYDGALVVMALAKAFGFTSYMKHGSWNGIPHVWAYVNGVGDVDATAIQGGYGLTSPKVSGGTPSHNWRKWASGDTNNSTKNVSLSPTINVYVDGNRASDDVGEEIGNVVVDKLVELLGVNPSTGL